MHKGLQLLEEGVFFTLTSSKTSKIEPPGEEYSCFMNHFYIDRCTSELTEKQVFAICDTREKHPEIIGTINDSVKDFFRLFVNHGNFREVLEIGSGSKPTFQGHGNAFNFTASDANIDVINNTRKSGIKSIELGRYRTDEITATYDLAFAVFVLHFQFSDEEINAIKDHLKPNGIFIANVYRLTEEKRCTLTNQFNNLGLEVIRVKDLQKTCKEHEYWVISKELDTAKKHVEVLNKLLLET